MRDCICGGKPYITLNDIDYAFHIGCKSCDRACGVTGYSPDDNHDRCVKLWNDRGWNLPKAKQYVTEKLETPEEARHEPDYEPPPPTISERLAKYKASKG